MILKFELYNFLLSKIFIEGNISLIGVREDISINASGIPQFIAITDQCHSQMST